MKPYSVLFAALTLGLCACQDQRLPTLEKRVADLESKVKTLEGMQKEKSDSVSQNQADFRDCVHAADDDFMQAVRSNGTKNGRGSYSVETQALREIERQKQSKLEECKLLYK